MHDAWENKCIQRLGENEGRHVGCVNMDCRVILKRIRKTGTGDVTGLNSLHLW
jgi:hypothetical protein